MALNVFDDPKILNAGAGEVIQIVQNGTLETVLVNELRAAFEEYYQLIVLFNDWKSGIIHTSLAEYMNLPIRLIEFRRIYTDYGNSRRDNI